ncbi:MAG: DUF4290 domain-containing protein [Crocinitomicaceae bacterium]|nr:DUF4290 domain-containing protein [Crocinitomicaceae bacterium]
MEYNTSRGDLLLPEYGRNVQNMIQHAMGIEDRETRNKAAQAIIEVMGQLNPHLRDVDDYKHKLWTHLFVMSDFKLEVDSPFEIPSRESLVESPDTMDYPKAKIRFGHFGKYTQNILELADSIEDEAELQYLTKSMANFMKKQFLMHNNRAVENHVIAEQLFELSNGKLKLENPDELTSTNQLLKTLGLNNPPKNQKGKGKGKNNNNKNNNNNRRGSQNNRNRNSNRSKK